MLPDDYDLVFLIRMATMVLLYNEGWLTADESIIFGHQTAKEDLFTWQHIFEFLIRENGYDEQVAAELAKTRSTAISGEIISQYREEVEAGIRKSDPAA